MEKVIFEPEKKMWEEAAERNKETFLQLVSPEAVMVCGVTMQNINGYFGK